MEAAKPLDDSLELGDSWRAMPRRTTGVSNKTNALYRKSVHPQQPTVSVNLNFFDFYS